MAKKSNKQPESVFSYFHKVFEENPDWLNEASNDKPKARYRADHGLAPSAEIPKPIMSALNNKKALLREQYGISTPRGKKRTKKGGVKKPVAATATMPKAKLEGLEHQIDECLIFAKTINRNELDDVIQMLRKARNTVVQLESGKG